MRSAPTLKIWMTPLASVAMLEKLALLKIAAWRAPVFSRALVRPTCTGTSAASGPMPRPVVMDRESGGHAARDGPVDFGRKAFAVERGLVHDRRHAAIQLGAIFVGDLLGGDHEDRD